jgi:3D (Asp-Asp-Asp) domain-containing protein
MHNSPQRVSLLLVGLVCAMFAYAGQPKEEGIETISETKSLKSDTVYEFSRLVGLGRIVKVRDGKDGSITKVFKLLKKEGKIVGKELIREEKIDAVPTTYRLGNGGYNASRAGGTFKAKKVLTMRASAYDPGPHSNGKWAGKTTLGVRPTFGIVAVDPRTIPLGSILFIEGYGFGYAADTGSAIRGNRIDLCMNSVAQCYQFGRKTVKVHVLGKK